MPELVATPADFDLARTALLEITGTETIGEPLGFVDEGDGVITVHLASLMRGYPDWRWTVSIARIDGAEPTVLETELLPGDGALLAPAWVPWEDRLVGDDATGGTDGEPDGDETDGSDEDDDTDEPDGDQTDDDEDDSDDNDDDDASDDDDSDDDETAEEDADPALVLLHAGDLDGVDIDEMETELDEVVPEGADAGQAGTDEADADGTDTDESGAGQTGADGVSAAGAGADWAALDGAAPADAGEIGAGDEEDDMDDVSVDQADGDAGGTVADSEGLGSEASETDRPAEGPGDDDPALPAGEVSSDSIPEDGVTVDGVSTTDAPTEDGADLPDGDEGLRGTLAAQ